MKLFLSQRLSNGKSYKKQTLIPIVGILLCLLTVPVAGVLVLAASGLLQSVAVQVWIFTMT